MKKYIFFFLLIWVIIHGYVYGQGASCAASQPFCTGTFSYSVVGTTSQAEPGPHYDCLAKQYGPAWFHFQVENPGNMVFTITGRDQQNVVQDVDFICYGPFSTLTGQCSSLDLTKKVACSYSSSGIETVTIPNAQAGAFYILLITNFSRQNLTISFAQTGGTGTTSCNFLSANPGECVPSNGLYYVSGTLRHSGMPATGTCTISDNSGASVTYNAPFSDPLNYSITGITADGLIHMVTATFSANPALSLTQSYQAPVACACHLSFTGLPPVMCKSSSPVTLIGSHSNGTFSGSGVSGNIFNPQIAGVGNRQVSYSRPGCPPVTRDVLVMEDPFRIENVLSATITTFSDNWPLAFSTTDNQSKANPFSTGSKGVWRPEAAYVYHTERSQTLSVSGEPEIDLDEDGVYEMALFDWTRGNNEGCADWRRVNTITRYNKYNFEVENKDILDVYSSALYGYDGSLTVAVAANASENEIAFESFEEYTPGQPVGIANASSGNFSVYTSVPSSASYAYLSQEYEIVSASENQAIVALSPEVDLTGKEVRIFGSRMNEYDQKNILGVHTVSGTGLDPNGNNAHMLMELNSSSFSYGGIWQGKLQLVEKLDFLIVVPGMDMKIVDDRAHSGKNSLAILGGGAIEQERLRLVPGRTYVFSAWISIRNSRQPTYASAPAAFNKRGVDFLFLNDYKDFGSSTFFEPEGPVVEGWQKIEGEFTVPEGTTISVFRIYAPYQDLDDYMYLDDVRIFPAEANMQSYVYDKENFKLRATLDQNNYATFYYYDQSGNLHLVKKETERGIYTVQESFGHTQKSPTH